MGNIKYSDVLTLSFIFFTLLSIFVVLSCVFAVVSLALRNVPLNSVCPSVLS